MCNHLPQHIPGNCPPPPFNGLEVEPYTQEEIACIRGPKYDFNPIVVPIHERWLLTLDALQARLAAAEAAVAVRDARIATLRAALDAPQGGGEALSVYSPAIVRWMNEPGMSEWKQGVLAAVNEIENFQTHHPTPAPSAEERAVVDAAVAWRAPGHTLYSTLDARLAGAVDAYLAAQELAVVLLKQAYRCGYSACGAGLDVTTRIDGDIDGILAREAPRPLAALRTRDAGVERALRECAYEALSRWEGSGRDAGRVCEIIDAAIAAGVAALKSGGATGGGA